MDERSKLRSLVDGIIQSQGNRFIKELLRSKEITIGKNKTDFEKHLHKAIDDGSLKLADVEEWLNRVEGWGEQHVYLYRLPKSSAVQLAEDKVYKKVVDGRMKSLWNRSTAMTFDEEDRLASVTCKDGVFRLVWQKAAISWPRLHDRDYDEKDGFDTVQFRAHLRQEDRTVTRFEARPDLGLAALFIAHPFGSTEHEEMIQTVWRVVEGFISVKELSKSRIDLSKVSVNIDQKASTSNGQQASKVTVQKSMLFIGSAFVLFGANSKEGSYHAEKSLQELRKAVTNDEIKMYGGEGSFWFERGTADDDLKRRLRVQLHRKDNRLRLWGQMDVNEVWTILNLLAGYEQN